MEITIKHLSKEEFAEKGIENWSIWTKEKSIFDWSYSSIEQCYILKGKAIIHYDDKKIEIKKNDFVEFPKGLKCKWEIIEDIEKYYNFL